MSVSSDSSVWCNHHFLDSVKDFFVNCLLPCLIQGASNKAYDLEWSGILFLLDTMMELNKRVPNIDCTLNPHLGWIFLFN